jgi:hypothetical protein
MKLGYRNGYQVKALSKELNESIREELLNVLGMNKIIEYITCA